MVKKLGGSVPPLLKNTLSELATLHWFTLKAQASAPGPPGSMIPMTEMISGLSVLPGRSRALERGAAPIGARHLGWSPCD
jgi:hypothetical protein